MSFIQPALPLRHAAALDLLQLFTRFPRSPWSVAPSREHSTARHAPRADPSRTQNQRRNSRCAAFAEAGTSSQRGHRASTVLIRRAPRLHARCRQPRDCFGLSRHSPRATYGRGLLNGTWPRVFTSRHCTALRAVFQSCNPDAAVQMLPVLDGPHATCAVSAWSGSPRRGHWAEMLPEKACPQPSAGASLAA